MIFQKQASNLENELELWQGKMPEYITGLAWAYDNSKIYASDAEGNLVGVVSQNGQVIFAQKAHQKGIMGLATSPYEPLLATAGQDGKINFYDGNTGELIIQHAEKNDWIEHLAWSPNGKFVASACGKSVKIWSAEGKLIIDLDNHSSTVSAIAWHAQGNQLVTACYGYIQIFDLENPTNLQQLHWKNSMISLAWSPDGRFIGAGTQDRCIHFWELPYQDASDLEMSGYPNKVKELSWNSNAMFLASNCANGIVIWNVSGKGPAGTRPIELMGNHLDKINQLSYQHQGDLLLSADDTGLVLLWMPNKRNQPIFAAGLPHGVSQLKWSRDDLNVGFGTIGGVISVWEMPY
ncbi:MAG: hypothetical protein MUE85_02915 [Microscillaceae bacterium]|jgi:WD40 repeat protein|nr:hypothetical protein [Microscillaceae bacterium]